jgi:hypothetical protein
MMRNQLGCRFEKVEPTQCVRPSREISTKEQKAQSHTLGMQISTVETQLKHLHGFEDKLSITAKL